ncbi:MAG: lysoplasmalogenase [Polyangiaceae bacterium]|nr:lysoplasmalogenase [Polyangiaceae bacterium]
MNLCAWVSVVATAALLGFAWRGARRGEWVAKPIAALGFVGSAWQHGALDTAYGAWVLAALVASMGGDVALIPRTPRTFLAGLGLFLLGHLLYACAFVARGASPGAAALALLPLSIVLALVARWLMPRVPARMKAPVAAYMVVITAMVALAVGTVAARGDARIVVAAVAFYVSDLSVARDRFVQQGFSNKLWGWPLYFGAQLVFAATVG